MMNNVIKSSDTKAGTASNELPVRNGINDKIDIHRNYGAPVMEENTWFDGVFDTSDQMFKNALAVWKILSQ